MKLARATLARASGKLTLVALAVIACPYALAQNSGWYSGASIGQSSAKIDDARISSSLLGSGFSSSTITDDDRDTAYKLYGGYQYNRYLSLEGGYFDLGKFGFTATTVPAGTLTGTIKLRGLNLDLVGSMPMTERFSAFARLGVNYAEAADTFSGTGLVNVINPNPSKRETNLKAGLGLQYLITDSLALRGELERYRINDAVGNKGDIDVASLGLVYRFGGHSVTPVAYVEAPKPVYMAPPPPPQSVAVLQPPPPPPPPPPPRPLPPTKVTFSADSLFDFDKASMKPGGQLDLDKFAADIKGTNYEVIRVTGHTDRLGPHAYNLKLSTRRAETVKNYLVGHMGIPADKISATGVNGSDPVTKADECQGNKASKALIACLQADRRVEVEVSGTR
jgi:OOP family OmpA-OmpF porin